MNFRYLKDPLFLICAAIYVSNKISRLYTGGTDFQNSYVNDLICIPFLVPMMLTGMRFCRLRRNDRPPEYYEIMIPIVVWASVFEVYLPTNPQLGSPAVGDPIDIICYCLGGAVAGLFWRYYYGRRGCENAPVGQSCSATGKKSTIRAKY